MLSVVFFCFFFVVVFLRVCSLFLFFVVFFLKERCGHPWYDNILRIELEDD